MEEQFVLVGILQEDYGELIVKSLLKGDKSATQAKMEYLISLNNLFNARINCIILDVKRADEMGIISTEGYTKYVRIQVENYRKAIREAEKEKPEFYEYEFYIL